MSPHPRGSHRAQCRFGRESLTSGHPAAPLGGRTKLTITVDTTIQILSLEKTHEHSWRAWRD